MERLFPYGTLQHAEVQLETFGRILNGTDETLTSYILTDIKIKDENVIKISGTNIHPILKFTGNILDEVIGTVYEITKNELNKVDDYQRVLIKLKSGKTAWIYISSKENFI